MTVDQHLDTAEYHGRLLSEILILDVLEDERSLDAEATDGHIVFHAITAAHHALAAQACERCGGEGCEAMRKPVPPDPQWCECCDGCGGTGWHTRSA